MEILNALQDNDLDISNALGDEPTGEEVAQVPAQEPTVDVEDIERRATERVLERLQRMAGTVGAPVAQESEVAKTAKDLMAQGVSAVAIENILKLAGATQLDKENALRNESVKQAAIAYEQQCWSAVGDALESVCEGIPQLKNAKIGLKKDLAEEVKDLVWKDKRFADVQKAYQSGAPLPKARLKEAAAAVADNFCKELGVTKPTGQVDLRSSKPSKGAEPSQNFDPDRLPKELRAIYDMNMNHFKDPKKAAQRVREAMRKGE